MSLLPLTLFTTCKPFRGEAAVMQENALRSWSALDLPMLVIGDDEGSEAICKITGARHIPQVERSAQGTPLLNSLFQLAKQYSDTNYLAYLNADIILRPDFIDALRTLSREPICADRPVISARRKNIPLCTPIFRREDSEAVLDALIDTYGCWDHSNAVDLFIFHRQRYIDIPPFSIGRMQWDNWLLWKAREEGAAVIDASGSLSLLHPIHGYTSHTQGWQQVTQGEEAQRNRNLSDNHLLNLRQAATHRLCDHRLDEVSAQPDHEWCQAEPEKLLLGALEYLLTGIDNRPVADTLDSIRSVLTMCDIYFPLDTGARCDRQTLVAQLEQAQRSVSTGACQQALEYMQDLLALPVIEKARAVNASQRPLMIWGCGQMAMRLQRLLDRSDIRFDGFIESGQPGSSTLGNKPVYAGSNRREWAPDNLHPFIVIASMYYGEISQNLESAGLLPQRDFMA